MKIFVVGSSRSGTTMMGRILGRHQDIFTFHELHFFEQLWSPSSTIKKLSPKDAAELGSRLLLIERDGYFAKKNPCQPYFDEAANFLTASDVDGADVFGGFLKYETLKNKKKISCDQTPRNVFYVDEILSLYPDAKIVAMVRDPRDVLLSQKNKWRRRFLGAKNIPLMEAIRSRINYHPYTISKLWGATAREILRHKDNPRVMCVKFESLLESPEPLVRKICEFLGIEFNSQMLNVPKIGSSLGNDQPKSVGINSERSEAWRNGGLNSTEIWLCERVNTLVMQKCNYLESRAHPNYIRVSLYFIVFPLQILCALVLNLRRMKRIGETIRRRFR